MDRQTSSEWNQFQRQHMNTLPLTVHLIVNTTYNASALVDSGCLCYALASRKFARRSHLERFSITPRMIEGIDGKLSQIREVVRFGFDLHGHREQAYAYVIDNMDEDIVLGKGWMDHQDVTIAPAKKSIFIHSKGVRVRCSEGLPPLNATRQVSATTFAGLIKKAKDPAKGVRIFAASIADINKALAPKKAVDVKSLLPKQYQSYLELFNPKEAAKLPPHRGPGVDHRIELESKDGQQPQPPWGPLYSMSRGELLVLRKELISLLEKGFIRVSSSPASAPVLFAKKPGGGLRLCIDYRALNAITKKDRYPLPLIRETLNGLSKAKWFTKLDVIAAFHKIRVAEGDEWKTAFRTRFGLFEWLVTPFGMANSPSTFQRYINWTLREHLDEFCSAYLDDVLVFTDGSLKEHREHVRKVLNRLQAAGLHVDIKKCEFEVKSTKYLGFIIEAGKGIRMDPEKIRAIKEWEPPRTVKGVRSFLGFANFYRKFIKGFSQVAAPLTRLTGDVTFEWGVEEQSAFEKLKKAFITEPTLATFDSERDTVLECDSSGYAVGGVLSQYDDEGILRPCAYFSRKNNAHECNYEIHDKELLAVIRCLEEWDAELRSVKSFKVITDHKNLEYFMRPRMLSERQVRWAALMSRFNMEILYRPGKQNVRADALSRREQDLPSNAEDERLQKRMVQVLKPTMTCYEDTAEESAELTFVMSARMRTRPAVVRKVAIEEQSEPRDRSAQKGTHEIENLWQEAMKGDRQLQLATQAVLDQERRFPLSLGVKCSIAECSVNDEGQLLYRGRKWVPNEEPLRTRIIEEIHNSLLTGHPGREITYRMVARDFFWPGMSDNIRRFVRNCDVCGRTKPWREGAQGLLKPLPIPDQLWKEISIDFVEGLPNSDSMTCLMVVTDRLSKGSIFIPLPDTKTETVVQAFLRHVVAYHWLPNAITSDRGSQFVSMLWERLCEILKINRRLSTAFHPQTDGSTERMNSVWEAYIRAFVSWAQTNWAPLCPMAQIAINGRDAASTGVAPFFLQHGYNVDPLQLEVPLGADRKKYTAEERSEREKAELIAAKFRDVFDLVQASVAEAQQEQERQANRNRKEARNYRVGDKVWLRIDQQYRTGRESRKLDWKNAKYTVLEVINSHSVRLDTPPGPHPVFHVDRLRLASTDPLPSQTRDDAQPLPLRVEGEDEYIVEEIMAEQLKRRGRGWKLYYEVKWRGYHRTSLEPAKSLEDTEALDRWEAYTKDYRDDENHLPEGFRRPTPSSAERRGVL
jgi:transposase InsO family protein